MTFLDWSIVGAYLIGMVAVGVWLARRQRSSDDYFRAGRRVPAWAAALAIVATSVSAATFLGAPEAAYNGNLTYLAVNIGQALAVVIVVTFFIPAFFRANVTTVYQLLARAQGPGAQRACSAAFMIGRTFASGARLYMAAIPVSLIAFGDLSDGHMILAVAIVAVVSIAYTLMGGVEAVVWTEVPQAIIFILAALTLIVLLLQRIDAPLADIVSALGAATAPDGSSKLTLLDARADPSLDFTIWSALIGFTLFNLAIYGADQDLAQRMLSCRNAFQGGKSVVMSMVIGLGVAALFLIIGLLLYTFYTRPDLTGAVHERPADSRQVILDFILAECPAGARGLMIAGVFAAAMSSLASSLTSLSSTIVCDYYRPFRPTRTEAHYVAVSRAAVILWGAALTAVAVACMRWQQSSGMGLLTFAIGVMIFAYAGILGVFLAAIFTRRGNSLSAALALLAGAGAVFLAQKPHLVGLKDLTLSLGWWMLVGTTASFLVCIAGRRHHSVEPSP